MTFQRMILFWLPVSLGLWGIGVTAGFEFWRDCLAPGVEFCAEGRR